MTRSGLLSPYPLLHEHPLLTSTNNTRACTLSSRRLAMRQSQQKHRPHLIDHLSHDGTALYLKNLSTKEEANSPMSLKQISWVRYPKCNGCRTSEEECRPSRPSSLVQVTPPRNSLSHLHQLSMHYPRSFPRFRSNQSPLPTTTLTTKASNS
jgi:hypothetical protein